VLFDHSQPLTDIAKSVQMASEKFLRRKPESQDLQRLSDVPVRPVSGKPNDSPKNKTLDTEIRSDDANDERLSTNDVEFEGHLVM